MTKIKIGLLIQSIITFFIGILLISAGLPSDKTDAVLKTGEKIVEQTNESLYTPQGSNVAGQMKESLALLGWAVSIISVVQFFVLVFLLVKELQEG